MTERQHGRPTGAAITSDAIKAARIRSGLTQAELAAFIGCSVSTITQWERGIKRPTGLYAQSVANFIARFPES